MRRTETEMWPVGHDIEELGAQKGVRGRRGGQKRQRLACMETSKRSMAHQFVATAAPKGHMRSQRCRFGAWIRSGVLNLQCLTSIPNVPAENSTWRSSAISTTPPTPPRVDETRVELTVNPSIPPHIMIPKQTHIVVQHDLVVDSTHISSCTHRRHSACAKRSRIYTPEST